jgi:FkbM family methyltransferase
MNDLIREIKPQNILHIGGHIGQEGEIYKDICSFTFVEPVPNFARIIRDKGYNVIEKAVGDTSLGAKRKFYVNNQISSFYKTIKPHRRKEIEVDVVTLESIQKGFDTLVVDTEGSVLEVLKSGTLNFDSIIVEAREVPAFMGEPTLQEIKLYLESFGYRLYNHKERDYLFIRSAK